MDVENILKVNDHVTTKNNWVFIIRISLSPEMS
jgi:hypothetical protein